MTDADLQRENDALWRVIRRTWKAYWGESANGEDEGEAFLAAMKRERFAEATRVHGGARWKLRER